jgi:hypothetical protein
MDNVKVREKGMRAVQLRNRKAEKARARADRAQDRAERKRQRREAEESGPPIEWELSYE